MTDREQQPSPHSSKDRVDKLIQRVNARMPNSVKPTTRIEIHPSEWTELVREILELRATQPPKETTSRCERSANGRHDPNSSGECVKCGECPVHYFETTPGIRLMDDGRAMGGSDVCWTCQAHCVEIEDLRRALTRIGELSASFKPVVDRVLAGYPIEGPGPAVETTGAQQMKVTDEMVTRFLGWKLPQDFNPDGGVTFTPINHPACWPIGTNLLTAVQARAMLEHVLAVETSALSSCNCPAAPGEDCPLTEHECDKRRRAEKA